MGSLRSSIRVLLAVVVAATGFFYKDTFTTYYNTYIPEVVRSKINAASGVQVFSLNELAQYNGIDQKKLYLAVLGSIFDVTSGKRHYEKGASYNYFVGKDGSRALVTGNFNDESKNKDHVLDLNCANLFSLQHWKNTFYDKYKPVGVLQGRYYDDIGEKTGYHIEFENKLENCRDDEESAKKQDERYPPCNIEWSASMGSRVWCTKTSGGVTRSWVGVPRQLFTPGDQNPRCVCVNLQENNSKALLKEYEDCPTLYSSCHIISN